MLNGMKNESGKSINFKDKLEAYSRWMKHSNMRIQDVGEEEDLGALARARGGANAGSAGAGKGQVTISPDDEDYVDISDPNQGKRLRVGRQQKRLPKDGHVRSFEELSTIKRKAQREKDKLSRKADARKNKPRKKK
jgi:ATP-dependent RNA helicase DDX54/DBP10